MDFKVGQSFGKPQPSGISIANRLPRLVNSPARAKGQPGSSALFFALTNMDTRQWYWLQHGTAPLKFESALRRDLNSVCNR